MTVTPDTDLAGVVDRLVANLARATGQAEQTVRLAHGLPPATRDDAIDRLRTRLAGDARHGSGEAS